MNIDIDAAGEAVGSLLEQGWRLDDLTDVHVAREAVRLWVGGVADRTISGYGRVGYEGKRYGVLDLEGALLASVGELVPLNRDSEHP